MNLHFIDNTPCPCIIWTLSGRDPAEFHAIQAEKAKAKKGVKNGTSSVSN